MRITELTLSCHRLNDQLAFYRDTLGLSILEEHPEQFVTQVGWTKLRFRQSQEVHYYHYCFLWPANQLEAGIVWLQERLKLVPIGENEYIQHFESWNAHSVYFWDGAGNLAECIVRYDLENRIETPFDTTHFLCVNEIGLPTKNVAGMNQQLSDTLGTKFWKGDLDRFGTHGDQEALFLLPHYEKKTTWFPTELALHPVPVEAILSLESQSFRLRYQEEILDLSRLP